ncbi:S49 family peptidase [Mesorhizobium sp.]|uniref:S49 family peptidase n=1 Tax=Mesorhizobium sp. TaxID=1871066 RepID=UPI0025EC8F32|nr:S49 family peptidase [Mesorhizobium sp.]
MQAEKLQAIVDLLAMQAAGGKLSAEEIEARISKQTEQQVARSEGAVAILPMRGVIANRMPLMGNVSGGGGANAEQLGAQLQAMLADSAIKAIVLDVDSPGGSVAGTSELSSMIFNARGRKPIVAQVNANAASAAYWIASAADEIVVTPSGQVGSIGVFGVHDDISKALATQGVTRSLISAGKFKVEGNPFEPLGDDARAAMQQRVDSAYDTFVRDVARNRGVSLTAVRDGFGQGRMVDAAPAVAEGMADKVGTMQETLSRFGVSLYPTEKAKPTTRAFAIERERRALDFNS